MQRGAEIHAVVAWPARCRERNARRVIGDLPADRFVTFGRSDDKTEFASRDDKSLILGLHVKMLVEELFGYPMTR